MKTKKTLKTSLALSLISDLAFVIGFLFFTAFAINFSFGGISLFMALITTPALQSHPLFITALSFCILGIISGITELIYSSYNRNNLYLEKYGNNYSKGKKDITILSDNIITIARNLLFFTITIPIGTIALVGLFSSFTASPYLFIFTGFILPMVHLIINTIEGVKIIDISPGRHISNYKDKHLHNRENLPLEQTNSTNIPALSDSNDFLPKASNLQLLVTQEIQDGSLVKPDNIPKPIPQHDLTEHFLE